MMVSASLRVHTRVGMAGTVYGAGNHGQALARLVSAVNANTCVGIGSSTQQKDAQMRGQV